MDAIKTFFWLLVQAVEAFVIVLPIFLGLVLNLIVSQLRAASSGREGFMPSMLAPVVWPFAILAVASAFAYHGSPGRDAPSPRGDFPVRSADRSLISTHRKKRGKPLEHMRR
jgi:hypothetical protein